MNDSFYQQRRPLPFRHHFVLFSIGFRTPTPPTPRICETRLERLPAFSSPFGHNQQVPCLLLHALPRRAPAAPSASVPGRVVALSTFLFGDFPPGSCSRRRSFPPFQTTAIVPPRCSAFSLFDGFDQIAPASRSVFGLLFMGPVHSFPFTNPRYLLLMSSDRQFFFSTDPQRPPQGVFSFFSLGAVQIFTQNLARYTGFATHRLFVLASPHLARMKCPLKPSILAKDPRLCFCRMV